MVEREIQGGVEEGLLGEIGEGLEIEGREGIGRAVAPCKGPQDLTFKGTPLLWRGIRVDYEGPQ